MKVEDSFCEAAMSPKEDLGVHRGPSKGWTKEARLVEILETFERGVAGVRGSAIADREGLPIANGFREPFDVVAVAAMATLTSRSSKTVFDHLHFRAPRAVVIEGEDAKVVVYKLGGGQATFIAVVRPDTNTGLLKLEMAAAARKLEEELGFASPTGTRIEEAFLMSEGGLLIAHGSPSASRTMDRDIVAGMFSAVQSFVKDTFRETGGGALEEMELAHLRVRIVRGTWATLVVVATGPLNAAYVTAIRNGLARFEKRNDTRLPDWDGDAERLVDVEPFLDDVIRTPTA